VAQVVSAFNEVGINRDSVFIDIGSGFGKVVFDVAISTTMFCFGIEMMQDRCNYSNDVLGRFKELFKNNPYLSKALDRVKFVHLNARN